MVMNEKQHTEILVGIFLLIGIIAITFLALRMGDLGLVNNQQYRIKAEFTSASGVKKGAHVEMAGVTVGKVNGIIFNPDTYLAEVIYLSKITFRYQMIPLRPLEHLG